jgi:outer membrane usher protein
VNNVSLTARGSRVVNKAAEQETVTNEVFAGLLFSFGDGYSGGMGRARVDDATIDTVGLQRDAPAGPGYGYRVDARYDHAAEEGQELGASFYGRLQGTIGEYTIQRISTAAAQSTSVSAAGSISLLDGAWNLARPIHDAFALVRVGDVEGVRVYASNHEVTRTDGAGEALVPNLTAYFGNSLSIEEKDVPFDQTIGALRYLVAPPYRGGVVVAFPVSRIRAVTGHLFFRTAAGVEVATYAGLAIEVDGETREMVVGKEGLFFVQDLIPGTYPARVFKGDRSCRFALDIPDSEEALTDLGEVYCEVD